MNPPPEPQARQRRYSVRQQVRLDRETHATLRALANTFHRKRAAIPRYVMQWGLACTTAWTIDRSTPDRPHLVHLLVDPELLQPVQDAADTHGAGVAAWMCQAMGQVTPDDCPPRWRAGETAVRSHESGYHDRQFQFRFDPSTPRKLKTLRQTFDRSAAATIRQLIAQARLEDFPQSWQLQVEECRQPEAGQADGIAP